MKRLSILLVFLPALAAAQDVQLANSGALLFNMGGLFSTAPSNFDGIGVGARYFPDSTMAYRGAVGFNRVSQTVDVNTPGGDNSTDTVRSDLALEGGLEWVLARSKKAYLYGGFIAQLGYGSEDPDGGDNDTTRYSVTGAGVLGASYFLLEGLSAGAEYRLGLSYASETEEQGPNEIETSALTLGVGAVAFHIGFWFNE